MGSKHPLLTAAKTLQKIVTYITVKKLSLLIAGILPALFAIAQYKAVEGKSSVKFTIKNFGINVGGTFGGLEGDISFDPKRPADASFRVSINANTVNTDNDLRDNHLKGESYFNTAHYPRISFESTKISIAPNNGPMILSGRLTIKNNTKEISFPFTAEPSAEGYLFKGSFTINRRDFNVGGFSIISDNAEITLAVFGGK